jgi:hypothetical protein
MLTAFYYDDECWLAGKRYRFELPEGAIRPRWERKSINVFGCGLVLDPNDKLAIFFTLNGKLAGKLVPKVLRIKFKNLMHTCFQLINCNINHNF